MANTVVHFELGGSDRDTLGKFYSELLGWKLDPMDENYSFVDTRGGSGINGGILKTPDGSPISSLYVEVSDLQETLTRIEAAGGTTVVPVTEIPNVVTYAMFKDPQGNLVGLVKGHEHAPGEEHDHGPAKGDGAPIGWFELVSKDPEGARDFYTKIFGWKIRSETKGDFTYYELEIGGPVEGAISSSQDGKSRVTLWASVPDQKEKLVRAQELGATVAFEPMAVNDKLTVSGIADPGGNFFGFFTYSG